MQFVRFRDRLGHMTNIGSLLSRSRGELDIGEVVLFGYGKSAQPALLLEHARIMDREDTEIGARQHHEYFGLYVEGNAMENGIAETLTSDAIPITAVNPGISIAISTGEDVMSDTEEGVSDPAKNGMFFAV
jgi:hypothetical protein